MVLELKSTYNVLYLHKTEIFNAENSHSEEGFYVEMLGKNRLRRFLNHVGH